MSELRVKRIKGITGEIRVPGDKSISHRSVILASMANGPVEIEGFLPSEDCLATVNAIRALGVEVEELEPVAEVPPGVEGPTRLRVHGQRMSYNEPEEAIDCGNSGTSMRLLAGMLGALPFESVLTGDSSLCSRPMGRIMEPLSKMGIEITAKGEEGRPPLAVKGGNVEPITYDLPVASAQVKSAILLAGLFAKGKTTVIEPSVTRDHTERMLGHFMVNTVREGSEISVYGGQTLESRDLVVPGDISSAAFWLVAAAAMPGAQLTVEGLGLNPSRTGILDVLVRMGARVTDVVTNPSESGEPYGHVTIEGGGLRGIAIGGDIIPNVIDELPIIAVAGALAEGQTTIRDATELRVKETDRISAVANNLRAFGVDVEEFYDGMTIFGGGKLSGARVPSFGDHRIAMAFAIAGLFADGETVIEDAECIGTSYPGFEDQLKALAKPVSPDDREPPVIKGLRKNAKI